MKYSPIGLERYAGFRIFILAALMIISATLEFFIHYVNRNPTGFTHFYYIFIFIVAILFYWKAILFGIYLAFLHLGVHYVAFGGSIDTSTSFRAFMFIFVAFLAGYVLEHIEREHGTMIAYLIERTLRERPSGELKADAEGEISSKTVAGTTIMRLRRKGNIAGLISALDHPDVETRYRAAMALGEIGDARAVKPLAGALEDENSGVRWEAAESLGKIGEPALDVLIDALQRYDDDDIRWRAAIALGDIGDKRVIGPLITAFADRDPYVRSRAVRAIIKIGFPAVDNLLSAYRTADMIARECVVAALTGIEEESGEPLPQILETGAEDVKSALSTMKDRQKKIER